MIWTKELLSEIEQYAELPGFTIKEIGTCIGMGYAEFKLELQNNEELRRAFDKGRLKSKVEFNKKVSQLSNQGSGPAQTLLNKLKQDAHAQFQELRDFYG